MEIDKELQKVGLSDKEARVYLAALELGQALVQNIATKSQVNRATSYFVLESLVAKGLCSTFQKEKKTYYIASNPDTILGMFEVQMKGVEQTKKVFESILPDLKLISNREQNKPVVKFYEGKPGMLNGFGEFYKQKSKDNSEPVRMIYNRDLLEKSFTIQELEDFRKVRLTHEIKSKALYKKSGEARKSTSDGSRIKLANDKKVEVDISMYDDRINISSMKNRCSAIIIQDKDIVETLKMLFDLAWKAAGDEEIRK